MTYQFPQGNVFYRTLTEPLPQIVRGEGVYLYDEAGNEYLDGSGGALVVNVGHGVPEIADAMAEQARKVAYVNGKHFTEEVRPFQKNKCPFPRYGSMGVWG